MVKGQLTLPMKEVKKSNEFVRSKLKLENVITARIFTSIIACIKRTDKDFKKYSIPAQAILPESSGGKEYKQIKKALKAIAGYVVEIPLSEDPDPDFAVYPLFVGARYEKGVVTAQVHPELKEHFIGLAGNFTTYNLLDYLILSTTYAQRLFEILNSYAKNYQSIELDLKKLQQMLNTPKSLNSDFAQFRRRVLEPAYKEITEKTRLDYSWHPRKHGRSVAVIEFVFSEKRRKEIEEKKRLNLVKRVNKKLLPSIQCSKEAHQYFRDNRCPIEMPKTLKCRLCKEAGYFLTKN